MLWSPGGAYLGLYGPMAPPFYPAPAITAMPSLEVQLTPGVWTNLIQDVISTAGIRATRGTSGSGPMDRVASPGVLTFTLRNDAGNSGGVMGWYAPDHAASRPGWAPGIPVRLQLTADGTAYPLWSGRIRTIQPEPGRYLTRYVEVTAHDAMADLTETIVRQIAPHVNQTEAALISAVVGAMPVSAQPPLSLDPGLDTLPYAFDDIGDGASALQLLAEVVTSVFGTLYARPDGTVRYLNRQVEALEGTQATFTEADLITDGGLVLQAGLSNVYNRVRATVHPRTLGASATEVLWKAGAAIAVPPTSTVTVWGTYADQTNTTRLIGGVDFYLPLQASVDYLANSAVNGSGSVMTGNIGIVVQAFASGAAFDITNTHTTTTAYLVNTLGEPALQLRGRQIFDDVPLTVEAASAEAYGDRLLNVDLTYQDDLEVAQAMVDRIHERYRALDHQVVRIGINPHQSAHRLQQAINLEIGQLVRVSEPVTGVNDALLVVRGVEWQIAAGQPATVTAWWSVAPSLESGTDLWLLDDAVKSLLDVSTILGVA